MYKKKGGDALEIRCRGPGRKTDNASDLKTTLKGGDKVDGYRYMGAAAVVFPVDNKRLV